MKMLSKITPVILTYNEVPNISIVIGALLIIFASIYIAYREKTQKIKN